MYNKTHFIIKSPCYEATNTEFQHCAATQLYLNMEFGMCA
jgi:hypothetical protein